MQLDVQVQENRVIYMSMSPGSRPFPRSSSCHSMICPLQLTDGCLPSSKRSCLFAGDRSRCNIHLHEMENDRYVVVVSSYLGGLYFVPLVIQLACSS